MFDYSPGPAFREVASTGADGVALQNGTPTFLSWTAPKDGKLHTAYVSGRVTVISAETGGNIAVQAPGFDQLLVSGSYATLGPEQSGNAYRAPIVLLPGETVAVVQSTALTAGEATFFGSIWAT